MDRGYTAPRPSLKELLTNTGIHCHIPHGWVCVCACMCAWLEPNTTSPTPTTTTRQVHSLRSMGVRAGMLGGDSGDDEDRAARTGCYTVLYITPEKLQGWRAGLQVCCTMPCYPITRQGPPPRPIAPSHVWSCLLNTSQRAVAMPRDGMLPRTPLVRPSTHPRHPSNTPSTRLGGR